MIVPDAYLVAVMAALGREELTTRELLEVVTHHRSGFNAEQCAALMRGEKVRPVLAGEVRT